MRSFEISDWGFFRFTGPDAKEFLQGLVTADLRALAPGRMLPACVLTPKGKLIADCELYEEARERLLAVTRPAAADGFHKAFEKKIMLSRSTLERAHRPAWLVLGGAGLPWTRLGEPAALSFQPPTAPPMSAAEFHAMRVAAGFPWYGMDMDADTLPLEARQEAAISLDKGCYMGQETVSRIYHMGHVNRRLVGLRFSGAAPATLSRGGVETGRVTSAAGGLGLGYVRREHSEPGTALDGGVEVYRPAGWVELRGAR